jgi:RHS repeat-associated protein
VRWSEGTLPTDFTFTGQRIQPGLGLVFMHARYYHSYLNQWISPDTIVPDAENPATLNRYAYCLGNPVKYVDETGHWAVYALVLGAAYVGGRISYEAASVFLIDSDRRDRIGGTMVTDVSEIIEREAASRSLDPALIGAVLRHESAAVERRLLTLWPTMQPGLAANGAEYVQSLIKGDTASIGPGQMQLGLARDLEAWGYVTPRKNDRKRRAALLGKETSVEYVAGYLEYLSDQLQMLPEFADLDVETQNRLTLIGYNYGWEGLKRVIDEYGLERVAELTSYDNQTWDEYERWKGEQ